MEVIDKDLRGLKVINPDRYEDNRGYFYELFQEERYNNEDIPTQYFQENLSRSEKGVVRGLHYQYPQSQGKLVTVLNGSVMDYAVDIRTKSETYLEWEGVKLSEENGKQMYIPKGFAHGFIALEENTVFYYKCSNPYSPETEHTIHWQDETLEIDWPDMDEYKLSESDENAPDINDIPDNQIPMGLNGIASFV